jgi:hypothetical protein
MDWICKADFEIKIIVGGQSLNSVPTRPAHTWFYLGQ